MIQKEVLVTIKGQMAGLDDQFKRLSAQAGKLWMTVGKSDDAFRLAGKSAASMAGLTGGAYDSLLRKVVAYDQALKASGEAGKLVTKGISDGFGNLTLAVGASAKAVALLEQGMKKLGDEEKKLVGKGGGLAAAGKTGGLATAAFLGVGYAAEHIQKGFGDIATVGRIGFDTSDRSAQELERAQGIFSNFVKQWLRGAEALDEGLRGIRLEESIRSARIAAKSATFVEREERMSGVYGLQRGIDERSRGYRDLAGGVRDTAGGLRISAGFADQAAAMGGDVSRAQQLSRGGARALGRPEDFVKQREDEVRIQDTLRVNAQAQAAADADRSKAQGQYLRSLHEQQQIEGKLADWKAKTNKSLAEGKYLDDALVAANERLLQAEQARTQALQQQGQVQRENLDRWRSFATDQINYNRQIIAQETLRLQNAKSQFGLTPLHEQEAQLGIAKKIKREGVQSLTPDELNFVRGNPLFHETLRKEGAGLADKQGIFAEMVKILGEDQRLKAAAQQEKVAIDFRTKIDAEVKLSAEGVAAALEESVLPKLQAKILEAVQQLKEQMDRQLGQGARMGAAARAAAGGAP